MRTVTVNDDDVQSLKALLRELNVTDAISEGVYNDDETCEGCHRVLVALGIMEPIDPNMKPDDEEDEHDDGSYAERDTDEDE